MSPQPRNPLTLKVGQVMTGFGAGCGVGFGVGYPIALGSIPVLGEMMSATSSAGSRAFGGVGSKAFGMLRKLGIKHVKAGAGCGVGIGYGFGVGIALKPGVSQQVVQSFQEGLAAAASQLHKRLPGLGLKQPGTDTLQPGSLEDGMAGNINAENRVVAEAPQKSSSHLLNGGSSKPGTKALIGVLSRGNGEEVEALRRENEILRTLLRHKERIEDLEGQNASIRRVLSEQFGVQIEEHEMDPDTNPQAKPPHERIRTNGKFHAFHSRSRNGNGKCFDCRVSARRRQCSNQLGGL